MAKVPSHLVNRITGEVELRQNHLFLDRELTARPHPKTHRALIATTIDHTKFGLA